MSSQKVCNNLFFFSLHHMHYILKSTGTVRGSWSSFTECCISLVCFLPFQSCVHYVVFFSHSWLSVCVQQIDEMLAGSLTQEDEEAVLAELEAITQVCT